MQLMQSGIVMGSGPGTMVFNTASNMVSFLASRTQIRAQEIMSYEMS
jgi:hypothetical protein